MTLWRKGNYCESGPELLQNRDVYFGARRVAIAQGLAWGECENTW